MPTSDTKGDIACLQVAGLGLRLDARESGISISLPPCYARFATALPEKDVLKLRVRCAAPASTDGWRAIFNDQETWQLWDDGGGHYVFVAPRGSPPRRQVLVDTSFTTGEIAGEFDLTGTREAGVYPLHGIDMAIVANWLAETGGYILHAGGIDDGGIGYAFAGPSGAGKSTLVSDLATGSSATVLGEDSVVVRYQEGQFRVYGTPWHTDPTRCSAGGVPLRKLFFLDPRNRHGVEPCAPLAGVEFLLQNALIPYYNRAGVNRILGSLARLAEQVPFYSLGFQLGADILGSIRRA